MENILDLDQEFTDAMRRFADNRFEESIDILSRMIERDANHRLARMARGSAYLKRAEAEKAVKDFDHAVKQDRSDARASHLRGLARELSGDDEGALSDITQAIALNPEYGAAYQSRSSLYTKMGEADLAMEDIEVLTALTQINVESYANDNNIWRSNQLRVEAGMETELVR